jgi:AraC-like DNA-binding protein
MARGRKLAAARSTLIPRVLKLYVARGADVAPLVARLGLPRDTLRREAVAVVPDDFEAIVAFGVRALGDPLLAVRLPELIEQAPKYGAGELAARTSPTLREAFERVVSYASLFYAHLAYACEERGDELVVSCRSRTGTNRRYSNEYPVAATLWHARAVSGVRVEPRRVFFAHAEVPERDELARFFGTTDIAFDRAESGVAFALADGKRASVAHDARLLATADELAEHALRENPPSVDFVAMVAARVRARLADGAIDAAAIARALGLGTRTLQRRLDEHGTTFTELVERERKDVAIAGVRDRALALAEVARRAGFSDVATFGRAFKRWTGSSPGELRKR